MLKGVIFDMDGTITLTENLHFQAYSDVFKKYGVSDYTFEEEVRKYAGAGSRAIFSAVFQERGVKITSEQLEACIVEKRALYSEIVKKAEIPVVAGVKQFIEKLEKRGIARIIATGNSDKDSVRFMLERAGVSMFFKDIVSVSEVGRGKPFPDVFLEAAKRINCSADEVIVCEDAINGVTAARAAGIRCIALETTTPRAELITAGAALVVKDYGEIPDNFLN